MFIPMPQLMYITCTLLTVTFAAIHTHIQIFDHKNVGNEVCC